MGNLIIDAKLDKLIKEIAMEINQERAVDLSYETIAKIVEEQLKQTEHGMQYGHSIVWKCFGTFSASKMRISELNKRYDQLGKKRTLEDYGLMRLSLNKKTGEISKTIVDLKSHADTYVPPNDLITIINE